MPCPVTQKPIDDECTSGAKNETTVSGCGSSGDTVICTIDFTPNSNASATFYDVPVSCGGFSDSMRILNDDTSIELRMFSDATIVEAYFQQGRVAMTVDAEISDAADLFISSTEKNFAADVQVYQIKQIWTTPDAVRKAERIYH